MSKKKVFLSFDYSHDHNLKGSLVAQAKEPDSPFELIDVSLKEARPEEAWLSKAKAYIEQCDVFIVLLGQNTHSAPGVLAEVEIAKKLRKYRFQIRPQKADYGRLANAGPVVVWKQDKIAQMLS